MLYTEKEVKDYIRKAVSGVVDCLPEWLEKGTLIKDKSTGEILKNAELDIDVSAKSLQGYIYESLNKKGIHFQLNETDLLISVTK